MATARSFGCASAMAKACEGLQLRNGALLYGTGTRGLTVVELLPNATVARVSLRFDYRLKGEPEQDLRHLPGALADVRSFSTAL